MLASERLILLLGGAIAAALAAASPTTVLADSAPGHERPGNAGGLHRPAISAPAGPAHDRAAVPAPAATPHADPPDGAAMLESAVAEGLTPRGTQSASSAGAPGQVERIEAHADKEAEASVSEVAPGGGGHRRGEGTPPGAAVSSAGVRASFGSW